MLLRRWLINFSAYDMVCKLNGNLRNASEHTFCFVDTLRLRKPKQEICAEHCEKCSECLRDLMNTEVRL